ncbi:MAG: hypothetical protein WAK84_06470 [Candidatus Cybelea sp.]
MDSQTAAREAGLRYVDDRQAGITRRRRGRHFAYFHSDGALVRDRREIERIKALAIPPAYSHVWISPIPNGHIRRTTASPLRLGRAVPACRATNASRCASSSVGSAAHRWKRRASAPRERLEARPERLDLA